MANDIKPKCPLCGAQCRFYDSFGPRLSFILILLIASFVWVSEFEPTSNVVIFTIFAGFATVYLFTAFEQGWVCVRCGAIYRTRWKLRSRRWHEYRREDQEISGGGTEQNE